MGCPGQLSDGLSESRASSRVSVVSPSVRSHGANKPPPDSRS